MTTTAPMPTARYGYTCLDCKTQFVSPVPLTHVHGYAKCGCV